VAGGIVGALSRLVVGTPMNYGLPKPDHHWFQSHPTVSQDFYSRVGHGDILVRPGIREFAGDKVIFVDGSSEQVDAVIWCTGYKLTLPFFDPAFLPVKDNYVPVWQHLLVPGIDNLFFIGLYQPLGSIMQPAEAQAKLVAAYLCGEVAFPDVDTMRRDMQREQDAMRRRYVSSLRHTMQVDFAPFLHSISRIARDGAKRARAQGNRLPVAARAR
jgi:hypothetical protein